MTKRLSHQHREAFDAIVQDVIDELPDPIRDLIDQVPVIVEDLPTPAMVRQLVQDKLLEPGEDGSDLCGLHSGVSIIHRTLEDPTGGWDTSDSASSDPQSPADSPVDGGEGPAAFAGEAVYLFRTGIISLAFAGEDQGGFEGDKPCDWGDPDAEERLYEEVRITLLHEIGHHFGLDEDDLDRLGYA